MQRTGTETTKRNHIDSQPRGKHGQNVYNLERDFGIAPAELRKRFDFHFEAFPVIRRPSE